jgi:hypothetical protein
MKCWKCGTDLETFPGNKIPFRATCDRCYAWLHCCKNCVNYKPGLPNDCAIPGTDYIADREACNFCEEYVPLGIGPKKTAKPDDVSKRLFGDSEVKPPKNFDDLFNK